MNQNKTYLVSWQQMKVTWRIGDNISFTGGIEGLGSISEPENEIKQPAKKFVRISATQCSKNTF